jgi:hypothetical protein
VNPDELLESLGLALGLPDLRFDANGCARLAIENAPALNFERDEGGAIHLYSVLGPLPAQPRVALYAQLLQGNMFGSSTEGATLSVDPLFGEVVLCRTVLTEFTSAYGFASIAESFVAAAEDWAGRLSGGPADATPPPTPTLSIERMDHYLRL